MMKKIFALVFILVLGKMSYSQGYPISQNLGSDSTIVISKGALQSRLAPIVISDTTAANNQRIKNYPGAQLYTANGDFYVRNATATKWVLVSSGSSGPINIYNSDGTLTGNRVLTGAGNSLTFSGISGLGINKVADSVFTVEGGIHATGGLRLENLASSPGTKALRINGQGVVSVADTSVVTGTVTSVGSGYGLSGGPITTSGTLLVDSAALSNYYLRRKDSLTATNSLGYVTKKILADTAAAIRASDAGGSVTSVATNNGTGITGGTITTSGTLAIDTTLISTRAWRQKGIDSVANLPRVTSVGLTMPVAFNVAGSPVTNSGTLAVTAAGLSTQYIRGDGQLANFPGGGGGGGSSVVYYFNGGTNQGTFVGNTYYEMSKTAIVGTAANFTINADGYITQFITDAGDPALLNIPAGNWNFEMYFSASSGGGSPSFYVELYKYDGTTFTLISSSSSAPEGITGGTATDLYLTALAVPATSLTLTDRLAVRVYVTHSGRTITLHTQDNTLCQVTTTFTTGITALNGLTDQVQYFATGTSGTDFAISSASATHTFNLPVASATNTGKLSSANWTTFNNKIGPSDTASMLLPYLRKADTTSMLANYVNNVGYGLSKAGQVVSADSATLANYFLRRKDSLTSTNLLGYVTRKILADTAAAIRSADAGGTVTSVATNNGTGITGGTFTTSGTIAADTLILSTRAWRQKGVDSLQANINLKLNISDTASMLSPYLRKIDTASLSNRINTKLNISDTSSMLTNYINDVGYGLLRTSQVARADSATLANYFLRRKDSLTSTNLLGYITRTVLADSAAAIRAASGSIGGSGTANRVSKFTASGTIGNSSIADSSSSVAMTILSNGNIGINTTAPNERLEIVGISRFTRTTSPSVYLNISMENGFAEYDARGSIDHVWENGGVENMRLALGGNLGIGTASPDSMLTVLQGARFQRGVRMSGLPSAPGTKALRIDANGTLSIADTTTGGGGSGTVTSVATNNGTGITGGTITTAGTLAIDTLLISTRAWRQKGIDSLAAIRIAGSGTTNRIAKFTASGTIGNSSIADSSASVAMTIRSNGNVGIGTSSPSSKFDLVSATNGNVFSITGLGGFLANFIVQGNGEQTMRFYNSASTGSIRTSIKFANRLDTDWNWIMYNDYTDNGANNFTFSNNTNGVAYHINTSNQIGIATTTIGSRLQVNGNAAIGYSASTAAPTNGLAVAGNLGVGVTSTTWKAEIFGGNASTLKLNNDNSQFVQLMFERNSVANSGGDILLDGTNATFSMRALATHALVLATSATAGAVTERFRINNTGLVFIGNGETAASPSTGIISGTGGTGTNIAGAEFRIRGGASTGSAAGGPITFYTSAAGSAGTGVNAATERMRINSDGNIGIGVSPSAWATTNSVRTIQFNTGSLWSYTGTNATNIYFSSNIYYSTGDTRRYINNGLASEYSQIDGVHQWFVAATGTAGNALNSFTTAMTLNASANLGIGTTTIGSRLQVNGNAAIGYSASTAAPTNGLAVAGQSNLGDVVLASNTTKQMSITVTGNNSGVNSGSSLIAGTSGVTSVAIGNRSAIVGGASFNNQPMIYWGVPSSNLVFSNGSDRMTLTSGGSLGIGTTTIGSTLQVNGNAAIGYSASTAAPTNGLAVAGNVGFGTTSPVTVLQIESATAAALPATSGTTQSGGHRIRMGTTVGTGILDIGTAGGSGMWLQSTDRSSLSTNYALLLNPNGGSVGIGTTSPSGRLHIDPADNEIGLNVSTSSLTGANAQSLVDLAQTWNTTGNPTAIKLNITNTASGATADLMELQVGGVNQFAVGKTGSGYFKDMLTVEPQTANTGAIKTDGYSLTGSNAQALLSMTGTWNTTGNPTAISLNITNTASGASAYLMDLQVGGTTQFRVTKAGAIRTAAPTSGTANDWKLGSVVGGTTVLDTTQWLEVEVGGTLYRVALVTLPEPEPGATPASTPEDRKISEPVKTSSQRIQELENEIQELRKMVNFLTPTSKNKK